jgi:aspartyl-tRNA(Asn)/glutamyl-tRNA(Gln) amidotransferase subunit A
MNTANDHLALPPGYFSRHTISSLGAALRNGTVSSVELVQAALDAILQRNAALNAFTTTDKEGSVLAAQQADNELALGIDRGPLHGIPVAVKDIIDVAGQVTTAGSTLFLNRIAATDAACVGLLRKAGAVIVGKTVLHEFAYGATGDRSAHGASRNPHDPSRISGGSSGGSAVAVASGMVPLALGTDTVGSVRVPAALCGIVGFKPAFDEIPTDGVYALASSLDHVGIFARTVDGVALAYESLVPHVPFALSGPFEFPRVAWISSLGPVDPAVDAMAFAALRKSVSDVPGIQLDKSASELFSLCSTIQGAEAYTEHIQDISQDDGDIDTEVLARLNKGATVQAWQYLQAMADRDRFRVEVSAHLKKYDVLALPTVPTVATKIGKRDHVVDGLSVEIRSALLSLTSPWNLTGSPSLTVPVGMLHGLPVGLQLICRPGNEGKLLRLATRIEDNLAAGTLPRMGPSWDAEKPRGAAQLPTSSSNLARS